MIKKDILNYIISQIKNKQIDLWREPTDEEIIKLIQKEIKSRQESISFLEKAWNTEEANIEKQKIEILKEYLPKMLEEEELKQIVEEKIRQLNIIDLKKQRWQLIWSIMKQYWPRVDGKLLNEIIMKMINDQIS
jgi:uncharacterized protein YqeY